MKRKNRKYSNVAYGEIHKHFGLFEWRECFFCGEEFRRERGYRFLISAHVMSEWSYACEACCCSKSHCNEMVGVFLDNICNNRPEASPPMRSYKND